MLLPLCPKTPPPMPPMSPPMFQLADYYHGYRCAAKANPNATEEEKNVLRQMEARAECARLRAIDPTLWDAFRRASEDAVLLRASQDAVLQRASKRQRVEASGEGNPNGEGNHNGEGNPQAQHEDLESKVPNTIHEKLQWTLEKIKKLMREDDDEDATEEDATVLKEEDEEDAAEEDATVLKDEDEEDAAEGMPQS